MAARVVALVACLAMLGGCGYMPSGSTEDLLVAPKLNARQLEVESALEATLDLESIQYKYPQAGDYRSPFIFYDLDNNGRQEAIVFYAYTSESANTRAKVLRQLDAGQWTTAFDISDLGDQIDFIQFASLLDPGEKCIVIGSQSSRRFSTLAVYSMTEGELHGELVQPYNAYLMEDFDGAGLTEIVTVYREDSEDTFTMSLFGKGMGGHIRRLDEFRLAESASDLLQILKGRLWDGSTGLYIDEELDGLTIITEIVSVGRGKLKPMATSLEGDDIMSTQRYSLDLLCVDLQQDGVVEIPLEEPLPGEGDNAEARELTLTAYLRLTAAGFEKAYIAAVNDQEGYLLIYPRRWEGAVTVVRQAEVREWQFCAVDPETGEAGSKLLRIRAYTRGDYQDKFTSNYIKLAEKGTQTYYAYIPMVANEPLAVTEAEVFGLFLLI